MLFSKLIVIQKLKDLLGDEYLTQYVLFKNEDIENSTLEFSERIQDFLNSSDVKHNPSANFESVRLGNVQKFDLKMAKKEQKATIVSKMLSLLSDLANKLTKIVNHSFQKSMNLKF